MAVYLTNGKYYIKHSKTGAVMKTPNISEAQNFFTSENAIKQKDKAPGKCSGYYFVTIDDTEIQGLVNKTKKCKRKKFSAQERQIIYRKTKGHCYLCGEFVDYDAFEIEHKLPLSKGGTNELNNLFPACHCCNLIKHDIYPKDFFEKISQIYLYQTKKKLHGSFRWKIIRRLLP